MNGSCETHISMLVFCVHQGMCDGLMLCCVSPQHVVLALSTLGMGSAWIVQQERSAVVLGSLRIPSYVPLTPAPSPRSWPRASSRTNATVY